MSLVLPILDNGAACWDPYRECQISALDPVQNKAAKFALHSGGSEWEFLAQRRKIYSLPTGILRLPSLRFFRDFSSVVRQMPGYTSQRRNTVRTLPNY